MNSNTASSSVVSLPPDTGRYHILPPSHVQSFTNHPLPPSPPRFAAYMRRDPLLPSPSPPPRLSAPIRRDTPPHLHTPLPIYTGPQAPRLRHLHLPAIHPMPDPHPPVPQQPQQVPAGAVQPLGVPPPPPVSALPPQPLGALPPQPLGVPPPHYAAPVMPPYQPPFPILFHLSRNMRLLLLSMRHMDTNIHSRRTLTLCIYRFYLIHLLPLLLQLVVLYLPLPIFPF